MPGIDPISAILGIGGNIVSGILGAGAARKAAAKQEAAANAAANRTNLTTQSVNTDITNAARETGGQLRTAAGEAIARNDENTINANKLLDPYRETGDIATGELSRGLVAGGDFNKTPGMADLTIDPGYEFRRAQAQKALEGSAAAHGAATGGQSTRDILSLNSGLASQEYQNAFNRFETSTQNRFNNLNTTANRGTAVAGEQGNNLISGAQYGGNLNYRSASDAGTLNSNAAIQAGQNSLEGNRQANEYLLGGANAGAAGIVGGANAIGGGIGGAGNAIIQQRTLQNLLKNPSGGTYNPRTGTVTLPPRFP